MFRFRFNDDAGSAARRRALLLGVTFLLASVSWTVPSAALAKSQALRPADRAVRAGQADADTMLIDVYKALAANDLRQALARAEILVAAYPTFRLGHLIHGDLLMMQTRPVNRLGAVNGPEEQLANLRDEALVRLKSLKERPDPDLIPRALLHLRDDQKHALVVDARRSRLYVYQHQNGRLKFVTDYYISQGKLGVDKYKEGDQKTPIGIYYVTGRLPGARLPDFYGSGALPINYPNEWDRLHGRSGSGIWLHGTPSDSYSRPPLSSDGCVVLTNPDLRALSATVEVGKTPIVISDSVEFINRNKWENERDAASRMLDNWRRDAESLNPDRLLAHYSRRFRSDKGEELAAWFPKNQPFFISGKDPSIRLREVTSFRYPGREELIVVTFTQDTFAGKRKSTSRKRQYWAREGSQWRIVYEQLI
jgi:murein L,D-transpeptidase YafK